MGSGISVIRNIFRGIVAAVKWVNADNARLREAKARGVGTPVETETADDAQPRKAQLIDPWEEIDNIRSDMWLGRWGRRYTTGSMDKLKKELKRDVERDLEKGKEKPE